MKKFILNTLGILSASCILIHAAFGLTNTSNRDFLSSALFGKAFCYQEERGVGWAFISAGDSAYQIAPNLGMPGPSDYYKIEFTEASGVIGVFTLERQQERITFNLREDGTLVQYGPNETRSLATCN